MSSRRWCTGSSRAIASRARNPRPGVASTRSGWRACRATTRCLAPPRRSRRHGSAAHDTGHEMPRAVAGMLSRGVRLRGYAFTVAGIAIGVAGLVALGAMSERIVRFIEGGDRFVLGQISVAGRGGGMGAGFTAGGMLPSATIRALRGVPGVAGVQPQVMLPLNAAVSQFMTLTQELILGVDLSVPTPNRSFPSFPVQTGRLLRPGDRQVAVLGASFAAERGLRAGDRLALDDQSFTVVGVLDRTLTAPDRFAIVPVEDARILWVARDPMLRTILASGGLALTAADLNTGAAVGWNEGQDPDALARRIREQVPGVNVQIPSELSHALRGSTAFFSALIVGIAALGLAIGGLSLANTVAAAVFERIRDFGVKRALG